MGQFKGNKHAGYKHGEAGYNYTRLYRIWCRMRYRCRPGKCDSRYYGDKGIRVYIEWDNSYIDFRSWAIGAGYQKGLTIHRLDSDGNYEPDNCIWMDRLEHITLHNRQKGLRGEASGRNKLFNREVVEIKELLKKGGLAQKAIGDMYGVSSYTINSINTGKTWAHISI